MAITEEEKIRRRKEINKDLNMIGAGMGGEVHKELRELPAIEKWINGDISEQELNEAIHNYVISFERK